MKNKGITLIALIVTVIIMIILAAISIRIITSGGIIDKTRKAAVDTIYQQDYEEFLLACVDAKDAISSEVSIDVLQENLKDWKVILNDKNEIECTSLNNNTFIFKETEVEQEIRLIKSIFRQTGALAYVQNSSIDFTKLSDDEYCDKIGFYEQLTLFYDELLNNKMDIISLGFWGNAETPERMNQIIIASSNTGEFYQMDIENNSIKKVDNDTKNKLKKYNITLSQNENGEYIAVLEGYNTLVSIKRNDEQDDEYRQQLNIFNNLIEEEKQNKGIDELEALKNLINSGKIDLKNYVDTYINSNYYEKKVSELHHYSYASLKSAVHDGEGNEEDKRVKFPAGKELFSNIMYEIYNKLITGEISNGNNINELINIFAVPSYDIDDIPDTILGYKVEKVEYGAFNYLTGLRNVVFPNTIKNMDDEEVGQTFDKGINTLEKIVFKGKNDISEIKNFKLTKEYITENEDGDLIIKIVK